MTLEQTRKLGIEFERRVQTMIPDKEFVEKLDTETIYSYLNLYQDKYIHEIFRNLDVITPGTKMLAHVDSVLQSLLHTDTILTSDLNVSQYMGAATDDYGNVIVDTARSVVYPLNKNFYMYVRSVSNVGKTYSFKSGIAENQVNSGTVPMRILPNLLISQNDLWRLLETPHDSLRILRYPAAVLTEKKQYVTYEHASLMNFLNGEEVYCKIGSNYEKLGEAGSGEIVVSVVVDQNADFATTLNVDSSIIEEMISNYSTESETFLDVLAVLLGNTEEVKLALVDGNNICLNSGVEGEDPITLVIDNIYYRNGEEEGDVSQNLYKAKFESVPTLTVIYDQYTEPRGIKVTYYKEPSHFSLMTSVACELPMDAFEELVSGAVDLYVQYVAGAVANKERIQRAREEAAKEAERNNARRNRREE